MHTRELFFQFAQLVEVQLSDNNASLASIFASEFNDLNIFVSVITSFVGAKSGRGRARSFSLPFSPARSYPSLRSPDNRHYSAKCVLAAHNFYCSAVQLHKSRNMHASLLTRIARSLARGGAVLK